jgi:ketosteroid isomerase-like protein
VPGAQPKASAGGQAENQLLPVAPPPSPVVTKGQAAPTTPPPAPVVVKEQATPATDQTAVAKVIETWRDRWQNGDADSYLGCYSSSFVPEGGMSRHGWRADRVKKLALPAMLKISLSDIRITMRGADQATATFRQDYASDRLENSAIKTLSLRREGNGWKITKEVVDEDNVKPSTPGIKPETSSGGQAENQILPVAPPPSPTVVKGQAAPATDKAAVAKAIETWRDRWQNADAESYLGCYSSSFVPEGGMSRHGWRADRVKKLAQPATMKITLSSIRITMRGADQAMATFRQDYTSDRLENSVIKTLSLRREGNGWKITKEVVDKDSVK